MADEKPETCLWRPRFLMGAEGYGDGWKSGCGQQSWFNHGAERMRFCPSCGKLIEFGPKEPENEED